MSCGRNEQNAHTRGNQRDKGFGSEFDSSATMWRIAYLIDHIDLLPELAQLHFEEWGHTHPAERIEDRIERLRQSCGHGQIPTTLIAIAGTELVGSALLVAHDMDARPELTPWLAGVFVKPAYRKKGIASQLIAGVESEAANQGVPKLYLYTAGADQYYAGLGWEHVERCRYRGLDVTVMAKTFTRSE